MFAKGQTILQIMEEFAPKRLAMPDDRIGLQLGTLQKDIRRILVTLDVTEEVVNEAVQLGADLIIAHHAIIYRPLRHLQTDLPAGRIYEMLLKNDIAVYISHTNLDAAEGGINDMMAEAIGLTEANSILETTYEEPLYKLVTFVPESHHKTLLDCLFAAGAGAIGNYSSCSFNLQGEGTFLPGEGTDPFIGKQGSLEKVSEIRVETIVPESLLNKAVQAMRKAHPYEEPAYDVYPLELKGRAYGLGRVGRLPQAMTLHELASKVKEALDVPHVRVVGQLDRTIKKAAVLGGAGSRYTYHALRAGADVLITGDIDFHTAQDALSEGLSLIDPGHHAEKIMKRRIADYLNTQMSGRYQTDAVASSIDTEPFQFL